MNLEVMTSREMRIIQCHQGIRDSMKQALNYALEAGELLTKQKEEMKHGEFLPWVKVNMPFSQQTASNYMRLHSHRDKLPTVSNLQEAYRQIETIEAQEKKKKEQENRQKIEQFEQTGEKPETWDRTTDYQYKKEKDDREFEERKQAIFEEKEEKGKKQFTSEEINEALDRAKKVSQEMEKHAHLNLSSYADTSNQSSMFAAIERYLNTFETESQQLEAAHNLIKKLKMVVSELQQRSIQ